MIEKDNINDNGGSMETPDVSRTKKEVIKTCDKCGTVLYKYRARPGLYCDKCKRYYYNK